MYNKNILERPSYNMTEKYEKHIDTVEEFIKENAKDPVDLEVLIDDLIVEIGLDYLEVFTILKEVFRTNRNIEQEFNEFSSVIYYTEENKKDEVNKVESIDNDGTLIYESDLEIFVYYCNNQEKQIPKEKAVMMVADYFDIYIDDEYNRYNNININEKKAGFCKDKYNKVLKKMLFIDQVVEGGKKEAEKEQGVADKNLIGTYKDIKEVSDFINMSFDITEDDINIVLDHNENIYCVEDYPNNKIYYNNNNYEKHFTTHYDGVIDEKDIKKLECKICEQDLESARYKNVVTHISSELKVGSVEAEKILESIMKNNAYIKEKINDDNHIAYIETRRL